MSPSTSPLSIDRLKVAQRNFLIEQIMQHFNFLLPKNLFSAIFILLHTYICTRFLFWKCNSFPKKIINSSNFQPKFCIFKLPNLQSFFGFCRCFLSMCLGLYKNNWVSIILYSLQFCLNLPVLQKWDAPFLASVRNKGIVAFNNYLVNFFTVYMNSPINHGFKTLKNWHK